MDRIGEIVDKLHGESTLESICALFSDQRYAAIPFSTKYFKPLTSQGKGKLAFIDGGNLEIFHSPDNGVSLIRIYWSVFEHNKRIALPKQRLEFYVHAYTKKAENGIVYTADIYPADEADRKLLPMSATLTFGLNEATLSTGGFQVDISKIGETARRFAEWSIAAQLVDRLGAGDVIVHDGTLQSSVKNESQYMQALYDKASAKGVAVVGFAKTTTLLTDAGLSLPAFVSAMARQTQLKTWAYHPIVVISHPDHQAEMFLVKLHENSRHVFRLEIYNDQIAMAENTIALLAENSKDLAFPGYPYGLIDADKNAGISLKEKQYHSLRISSLLSGRTKAQLSHSMLSTNAHDVIDRVV